MTRPTPTTDDLDAIVNGAPEVIEPEPDPRAEAVKETISTALSTAAILLLVVGGILGAWPYWGAWSLCAGGVLLAILVAWSDANRRPKPVTVTERPKPSAPGPKDAGNLHTKGPGARK